MTTLWRSTPDPMIVSIGHDGDLGQAVRRSVAHLPPGVLHVAASLQVVDQCDGRWLLQRRSVAKVTFSHLWANTCCTHPAPGEAPAEAVARRAQEELGLVVGDLVPAGVFTYRAYDKSSGFVEYERDFVYVALADTTTANADPDEVSDLIGLPFHSAIRLVASDRGAPWAPQVLRRSLRAMMESGLRSQ